MQSTVPKLVIINQTTSPAFSQWVNAFAAEHGPVEFWCGNVPDNPGPNLILRRMPVYKKSSILARLRTWGWFTIVTGWQLIRRRSRPALFVVTNPPFLPLLAWLLHKTSDYRYGILEYDIYPQIAAAMGMFSKGSLVYRLWVSVHRRALRAASLITTLSEPMARELRQIANCSLSVAVIPTWADTDWIKPLDRASNPFAQELRLDGKLVVLYSGNMGATHSIETIISVAEYLRSDDRVVFLMIGEGSKRPLIEEAIKTGRTPNIHLLPWQPQGHLPYTLSTADIGVVTLGDGYEFLSMPSKTYSMMAAGGAILGISTAPNGLTDLIETHECGSNFSPAEVGAIANWLRAFTEHPQQLGELRSAARAAAVNHFSRVVCESRLTELVSCHLLP